MNGRVLLDTSVIIALFKNDDNVRNQMAATEEVFVPAIAIGELFYGAQHSSQVAKHMKQVREFAQNAAVLTCDASTAEHYGRGQE